MSHKIFQENTEKYSANDNLERVFLVTENIAEKYSENNIQGGVFLAAYNIPEKYSVNDILERALMRRVGTVRSLPPPE